MRPVLTLPALPSLFLFMTPASLQLPCQPASVLYKLFQNLSTPFARPSFLPELHVSVLGALSEYVFPQPRVKYGVLKPDR